MIQKGIRNPNADLAKIGFQTSENVYWNLNPQTLTQYALDHDEGTLSHNGTLCINTGRFTGRSPKDRYIVKDSVTSNTVDWGDVNKVITPEIFNNLKSNILNYLSDKNVFAKDAYVCSHSDYKLNIRLIAEKPWSAQFAHNMFRRLSENELLNFTPEWNILCAPGYHADPIVEGIRSSNFAIINFESKTIIIGGTGYTGEIKKGIFSVLNFLLAKERGVLPMHCSANIGESGDTAVFFGLSGTGKTTLSADPNRALIGDDEHGWSDDAVFNFEGGCYAKCIGLSEKNEPEIFHAIKPGAILENIGFEAGTNVPNFDDVSITQNTRVSYPLEHISNAKADSKGGIPKNIFFLTCDAFGVLPPISKLTAGQTMYHFISGYTAKVAGTEDGIDEPQATFSACFGAPFMPLHPTEYADMLGEKMTKHKTNIWLINTGWSTGSASTSDRISLKYTRAMITAALKGKLDNVEFKTTDIFGLKIPAECPNVPSNLLNSRDAWLDKDAYDEKAAHLANLFQKNFAKFEGKASAEIIAAAPKVMV
tara:strand:+ start:401 stop:2008 length:1608 start_codon:yes stop_codon:yes gene_type:complete